jgi:4-alpha-glucanotransferase
MAPLTDLLKTSSKDKWRRVGARRRAGVAAPLFSVYSKKSIGLGDFSDLKHLIDWCGKTGNSILQLLPMNEVSSTFCPYDAVSSFALEPAYLSLDDMECFKDKAKRKMIESLRADFPCGGAYVNYKVKEAKLAVLRDIYSEADPRRSKDFSDFINKNSHWLEDFGLYKTLKRFHGGRPWYEWEDKYANRDTDELRLFREKHEGEIAFEMWVQWLLHGQFKEAKAYAGSRNVFLKGDLPILISRDSADVWARRELFKLEYASGAPPDMYCAKGQRWGMPTYNWERIAAEGYDYFRRKLRYAENFYDMLRIDHVVGLFRIWSIPYGEPPANEGLNGFFDPQDENVWGEHGKTLLEMMLSNTDMLLCAEDLGIIPKACPKTLEALGMPGNDIARWTKDWAVRHDFLEPSEYRFISAAALSTHDTTNWAAWWHSEAGTVDEKLFMRKCAERGIDYGYAKERLFDGAKSAHGRLRWLDTVESSDVLLGVLGKKREEALDFIEMYENSFREKEKLWKKLGLKGAMKEKADERSLKAAIEFTLRSNSVFCVQLLVDYLMLAGLYKGDPYRYRLNTPGTVSGKNWSLTIPISLEALLKHKVSAVIKEMVASSGRR